MKPPIKLPDHNQSPLPLKLLNLFLLRRRRARLLIIVVSLLAALVGILSPLFQKQYIDGLMGADPQSLLGLGLPAIAPLVAILFAFAATLLSQALNLFSSYLCMREGTILQKDLSEQLYRKMLSIKPDSMGSTTVGEVVSIYATDVQGSTALVDQVLPMATAIFFNLILAPIAIHLVIGIPISISVFVIAIIVLFMFALALRQSRFFARFKQLAAERAGLVNEWVQTIRLLRILGWVESFERKIFAKREEETRNRVTMVTNGQFMNAVGSSINYFLNLIGVASLIYLSRRTPTPGELFALLWIFGVFLVRPFRQLPWFFTFTFDSVTSMARVEKFLSRPSDAGWVEEAAGEASEVAKPGTEGLALSVKGLSLTIGQQRILHGIDLDVKSGEFVAIVGEVGSGKSLLLLSLVGETGAVFESFKIGVNDALRLSLAERRKFFSFVAQEGFVMSASLRENIGFSYDLDSVTDSEISRALSVAQFRAEESSGLGTEIGERGVNLSGGQRQRVSLARAHRFDRPVVLLDDCLSAVDVDTERNLVRDLLTGAWRGKTRLLVTHRLSVLNQVDRVLFIENGRIVEDGPFSELVVRSARVREFVASVKRSEEGSPIAPTLTAKIEETVNPVSQEGDGSVDAEPVH